ncbi:hypothetical protein MCEMIH16_03285 [Caulobacteraceae bacterium]|jgi:hypothetical protein
MNTRLDKVIVTRLSPGEIDEAFWLARLTFPDLTPARWRATARRWTAHPTGAAGALLARDAAGRLIGLAPFAVRTNLQGGRSLWVEKVASFALLDGRPVVRALAESLREVARALGCRGLTVQIDTGDTALLQAMSRGRDSARCTLVRATL